jgi:hypothetical protein
MLVKCFKLATGMADTAEGVKWWGGWPVNHGCFYSPCVRLRARFARFGYQYLRQYPNTSFRIFRKTRLRNFRILNNEYWYSDTEYSSHINF